MKAHQIARIAIPVLALSLVLIGLPSLHPSRGQNPARVRENANRIQQTSQAATQPARKQPTLSTPSLFSGFARHHKLGAIDTTKLMKSEMKMQERFTAPRAAAPQAATTLAEEHEKLSRRVNADFNKRPQNETSIALHPHSGQDQNDQNGDSNADKDDQNGNSNDDKKHRFVIGANDYAIGAPIGTGVYNSEHVTYFPPFPLLAGLDGEELILTEPPILGGDPALAYGFTREAPDVQAGTPIVYYASLAASSTFAENGIIVQRSFNNGRDWNRPVVPPLAPPKGVGIVTYWDQVFDFAVANDKEYIAVDNTGGPHNGRVYVTWTRFQFSGDTFIKSPINMAFSDDNGLTFSDRIEISGASQTLCPNTFGLSPGVCDADQDSYPVVLADGTLVVVFTNFNNESPPHFRDQLLAVRVNPDTRAVSGPYKVANIFNGADDLPFNEDGRFTLCNSNFRVDTFNGNIAVGQDGTLYTTWWDNRAEAGQFPFPTFVGPREEGYPCPAGKTTDGNVFLKRSTDGGRTWSSLERVNGGPPDRDQWFPWVAAGPAGRVDVVFFDRSRDPNNKLANTFVARSTDSGQTFTRVRVSDFESNFDNAFFDMGNFIGDYNGMAMDSSGRSFPVWTGVKPGKNDSDIFMAILEP